MQSHDGWVTVLVYSKPISRWTLNAVYSLIQYGMVSSYVVAAVDAATMQDCQQWRLPCFLADWALEAPSQEEHDDPSKVPHGQGQLPPLQRLLSLLSFTRSAPAALRHSAAVNL